MPAWRRGKPDSAWSVCHTYLAAEAVSRGELMTLFEDWQVASMPLYLAFAPTRHVSAKLRMFIDWVIAVVAQRVRLETPADG